MTQEKIKSQDNPVTIKELNIWLNLLIKKTSPAQIKLTSDFSNKDHFTCTHSSRERKRRNILKLNNKQLYLYQNLNIHSKDQNLNI